MTLLRTLLLPLLISLILPCLGTVARAAPGNDSADKAAVLAAEAQWLAVLKSGDSEGFAALLDENFFYNRGNGTTLTKTQWVAALSAQALRVDALEREELRLIAHGDVMLVTGLEHVQLFTRGAGRQLHERFTHVWRKQGSQWRIIARQGTYLPASATGDAADPLLVTDEPLHLVRHRGEHFMIYTNYLMPGITTLYHSHRNDLLAVIAGNARVSGQVPGEPAKEQDVPAGAMAFFPYADGTAPYVHRVAALGTTPFINVGIDFLDPPAVSEPGAPATTCSMPEWTNEGVAPVAQNRRGRGYRVELAAGSEIALPAAGRAALLAPLQVLTMHMDETPWQARPGEFRFYDQSGGRPARLKNNGSQLITLAVFLAC